MNTWTTKLYSVVKTQILGRNHDETIFRSSFAWSKSAWVLESVTYDAITVFLQNFAEYIWSWSDDYALKSSIQDDI